MISIIAAMSDDRVIGIRNRLPWKLPADMRWFRRHTLGKPVVMGRKTFESLGRPLPERTNIVISRDPRYAAEGCLTAGSVEEALVLARSCGEEVMIIGGASFYAQTLAMAERLYLTLVHDTFEGDAWFPEFDLSDWRVVSREDHEPDEKNPHACSFLILERAGS